MPPDESEARARRIAAQHGHRVLGLLGEGTDHAAFLLDGDVVLRVRKARSDAMAGEIDVEARLLDVVGAVSPLPTPQVVFALPEDGAIAVVRLEGTSLLDRPCPEPARLVDQLQAFLGAVHGLAPGRVDGLVPVDDERPAAFLDEARQGYSSVTDLLDTSAREAVERFLTADAPRPPEPAELRVCHGDLGAEHLLAGSDGRTLTGVIDWADAAFTDPARDLGRLHRDLGPEVARRVAADLDHLDAAALERAAFHARCAVIEDLVYGVEAADPRYLRAATAAIPRTFGSPDGGDAFVTRR
jgi:aminoglycoside phosphotransferase (APT) family kinase protein